LRKTLFASVIPSEAPPELVIKKNQERVVEESRGIVPRNGDIGSFPWICPAGRSARDYAVKQHFAVGQRGAARHSGVNSLRQHGGRHSFGISPLRAEESVEEQVVLALRSR